MIKSCAMPKHRGQNTATKQKKNTGSSLSLRLTTEHISVANQPISIDEATSPSEGVIPNWLSVVDTPTRRI
ncbi:hypothetical protein F6Q07_09445 [Pectobacterium parmentieri]|uniref:Uncharacterized protein n=1 Tax=Pectobacterium parmentieri TaxID=1905730 RepID=A0A8B3FMF4_PECPM|nr:hypothetical protein C5E26_03640 [Pectobacterium parmentieri]AYH04569.1 hypothetical protein C5E25_03870 [Pectobacterium parmentieri]AYH08846.1 hypothetical protein C5E24_03525 [Pectobacterium parmentieri]AYH13391.1 hypothetical protein C5E23_03850 [Pectobacterium parmentieri]AYH20391.1 hypothetical protein C5E22_18980 [Pectobacterium parmentieri]